MDCTSGVTVPEIHGNLRDNVAGVYIDNLYLNERLNSRLVFANVITDEH